MRRPRSLKRPPGGASVVEAADPVGQDDERQQADAPENGQRDRVLREAGGHGVDPRDHERRDVERGLREDADRERPVRRERERPERVHVGSVLEVHVLDGRHEQDGERKDLDRAAEEEHAQEKDRRRDLARDDGERGERDVDPVAPSGEDLAQRLVVALLAPGLLAQELVDGADVLHVREVGEDRQHDEAERQRPPLAEATGVHSAEPPRKEEARHEQRAEDRAEEDGRLPVGVDAPEHAGEAHGHPPALPVLLEPDVAPRGQETAEDERPLEPGEVTERQHDRQHGVRQRGQGAGHRAPERPADPVEERRAGDAHEHGLEPRHERVAPEHLRQRPDHPVRSPWVVHVVLLRGRATERVLAHGAPDAPRDHVVCHDSARGHDRPVAAADGTADAPDHREREPDGRDDDDDLRNALDAARRHAARNLT